MEFRILGPVEVVTAGARVTLAPKERMLFAALLVAAGQVVSADRLIHELWGSDPPGDPPRRSPAARLTTPQGARPTGP